MIRQIKSKSLSLLLVILLTGCASYTPTMVRLDSNGPMVRKKVNGDLTLYVEEYATTEKSQRAFDTDLAAQGVIPLMVRVENGSQATYEVTTSAIVVRGKSVLKALTPEEAASKAERSAVGRALGWSMIVPIIGIPIAVAASAMHTNSVNKQVVQDFTSKFFPEGAIAPHKERAGFMFYELKDGRRDLSGLTLKMAARNVATDEIVTIDMPLPSATFAPVEKEESKEEEEDGFQ